MVAIEEGRCVHQQIVECGWDSDVFVGSSLVDMYAKCGSMEDAGSVFNKSAHAWQIQVTKSQGCSCRTAEIVRACV
jgi:hypothetical protein